MATSGIWNHAAPHNSPVASSAPHTDATAASSAARDTGSNISANDFLTLLVTEMQNQDPTANTDPNEYINQLVQVNSLEQLISINQTLSAGLGSSATGGVQPALGSGHASSSATERSTAPVSTSGNLAMPRANATAQRIAQALGGHTRAD